MFGVEPNCEYVWNSVSVYHALLAGLQRKPTKSVAAVNKTHLLFKSARLLTQLRPSTSSRRHFEQYGIFTGRGGNNGPWTSGMMRVAPALARATRCTAKALVHRRDSANSLAATVEFDLWTTPKVFR
jgi:hypothetical protein